MEKTWTVRDLIDWTAGYLAGKGIETSRLDAELLLAHLLDMDRVHLYINFDLPLDREELAVFRGLVKRRAGREPLQYITGIQEFWSMKFRVTPSVLIPRPESEILVEEGAKELGKAFPAATSLKILDIGTGSGALAAALAKEVENSLVTGVDVSEEAVVLARENIEQNSLSSSVTIIRGDLLEPLGNERFHLIVSNPPYIPHKDLDGLQPEVRDYEPLAALDGGADGLNYYRKIIPEAPDYLEEGGWLMVEHGEGQSDKVTAIFQESGFNKIESVKDYAGIDRVVKGQRI